MCDLPVWRGMELDGPAPWWVERCYGAFVVDWYHHHGAVPAKKSKRR